MHSLYRIQRFQPALDIWQCSDCRLQENRTRPDDLEQLYEEGYYTGEANYIYEDERKQERANDQVWQERLKTIGRFNPPPGDFLDVGCSFGGFVEAATRAGYNSCGLDISAYAIEEGRAAGRNLIHGQVALNTFEENSFDVITLVEVMEHLPDPQLTAQSLFRWLKPGGLLLIQTANFAGWQAKREGSNYHYYLPGHLYYYDSRNLKSLLKSQGFQRFKLFRPVDFPLSAKLRKMRLLSSSGNTEIKKRFRTSIYHLKGRIALGSFALTSSMVLYAWK